MRKQITGVALLTIAVAAGLSTLDAALGSAKGLTEESALRVLPAAALLMVFLLHRPVDRI
jgi:choline-glycine betaine transporter